ncbi:glycoside hydrolase family 3 protein [bacterium]|nr:glycoside hydrolase family 3 protein [bacterium]
MKRLRISKQIRPYARVVVWALTIFVAGRFFGLLIGNGVTDLANVDASYENASLPMDARIEDLLSRMTTEEKVGQMALVEKDSLWFRSDIARYGIGGILSGAGAGPDENTPEAWFAMVNGFQRDALENRLHIPMLYGVDAVHGNANVIGATVFPHAIGLGAGGDAELVRRIGAITANELVATGIHWNFAPSVDVVEDTRWGRTYETFGSNSETVARLGAAYLQGLQSETPGGGRVIGTAKHYLGTGAMTWGTSGNPDFHIDQGVTDVDEATLRETHLPPFAAAVNEGVSCVMVGHAAWNGIEMAANRFLLTNVLKGELGFDGFVVSDWYGVYEIPGGEYHAVVEAVNAGVDMVMLPYDYVSFVGYVERALANGDIAAERVDDAVRRILRAKFVVGLFDASLAEAADRSGFGSAEHRLVAREAVRKSLVLLKDDGAALPIRADADRIVVGGSAADNIGRQSGGWTVEWQGIDGNWIPGTTILQGLRDFVSPETSVAYSLTGGGLGRGRCRLASGNGRPGRGRRAVRRVSVYGNIADRVETIVSSPHYAENHAAPLV